MMQDNSYTIYWKFPGNGHLRENGLYTSDMETFMKDPIASLAREICQNTIDAKLDNQYPVRLEFKTFYIDEDKIPGKQDLLFQIKMAIDNWKNKDNKNTKLIETLESMHKKLNEKKIKCLRISDFNTTGLLGVSDNNPTKPFYMLTKGSGISFKDGSSGGSKGIGKYATFVVSQVHTLFYSTVTMENETGHIGIAKLCSGNMVDDNLNPIDEKTFGEGYYGDTRKNLPINGILNLDPHFNRNERMTGTDIFVIAFDDSQDWVDQVAAKILDSFMVAIQKQKLTVKIENREINSATLEKTINDIRFSNVSKKIKKQLISQFILLTDPNVYTEIINVNKHGEMIFKLKVFDKANADVATNNCSFIRYPYMKIKDLSNISNLPCSAIAIIEDNNLNRLLRNFENPQHTDWEFNRTDYTPAERYQAKEIFQEMKRKILEIVFEQLSNSDNTQTDFDGAEEYLPDEEQGLLIGETNISIDEKPTFSKVKRKKVLHDTGYIDDEEASGLQPEIGSTDEGKGISLPEGENQGDGGKPRPGESEGALNDGDNDVLKIVHLSGIKYRLISIDSKQGKYLIRFNHVESEKKCDLHLKALDDSGNSEMVVIKDAYVNGIKTNVVHNVIKDFQIKANTVNEVIVTTDQNEYFSGDVKIYAYR